MIACLFPALFACAKGEGSNEQATREVKVQGTAVSDRGGGAASQVPLGTRPSDECGWIPAAEVEALVGPLAEPPRPEMGGCMYTLQVPAELAAKRAKIAEFQKRIGSTLPNDQKPYAFVLQVDLGVKTGERAERLAMGKMASWLEDARPDSTRPAQQSPTQPASGGTQSSGWDAVRFNGGRLGSIDVTAIPETSELRVPSEKLRELTARVRDRIPDLPFPSRDNVYQQTEADPCTLLTGEEAESVLGKLVVAPYRSASDGPLALSNGRSCAYFTARHHALIVRPYWSDGKFDLAATRGVGGLMSRVVSDSEAQSADTIEGPWDETAISVDGRLVLRKGDRAVEIEYETSSTDKAGALRLGKIMVERLAQARP
ncbi:MAG: hypothetical protein DMD35_04555 [Gemmatimonadetes bacterium]|nr:MAG: hypothetical protein DMD35_04555 [Gemmatimonadota bacterium]